MEAQEALALVQKLPSQQRDALMLIVDGAGYEEIAKELVIQVGTVKSKVNRARILLAQGISA